MEGKEVKSLTRTVCYQKYRNSFFVCIFSLSLFVSSGSGFGYAEESLGKHRVPVTQWNAGIGATSGDRTTFRDSSGRNRGSAT